MTKLFTRFDIACTPSVDLHATDFAWSDWDPYPLIPDLAKHLQPGFESLPKHGHVMFSTACAEICVDLLVSASDASDILMYMDALWAPVLSKDFITPDELDYSSYTGKRLGMIALAFSNTTNTWYGVDEGSSAQDAAMAYDSIQHILGGDQSFHEWVARAIGRLIRLSKPDGSLQLPLPIEVLCNDTLPADRLAELSRSDLSFVNVDDNEFVRRRF